MTKATESKWRALIAAQDKSGLSVREFADARGISPATLYWWRSKLRREGTELVPLVPVQIVDRRGVGDGRQEVVFELRVNDAMTLHIPVGFDEAELRRLIRALQC